MDGFRLDNEYIDKLFEKANYYNDEELKVLIQQLLDERNRLYDAANKDFLTGLNNRRVLDEIDNYSAVVMIDIDDFKDINDSYGHDIGDYIIKLVANILKNNTRSDDYICRLGGDEFAIIFTNCPLEVVRRRSLDILNEVRYTINALKHSLNVSIGIAINTNEEEIIDVIRKADYALYESKKNGKGMISEFDNDKCKTMINKLSFKK